MDILLVVLGEAQAMTQFKSTSRTKVKRSHSCAQLKTDHFSGSKKYKLKSKKEKLLNQYKCNCSLIDKVEDFHYRMFLQCVFIFKLPKTDIKRLLRVKKIKTNNDFYKFLNDSLVSFSYVIENEYRRLKEA